MFGNVGRHIGLIGFKAIYRYANTEEARPREAARPSHSTGGWELKVEGCSR